MDRFGACLSFVLQREGSKFTNDPTDRGGATRYGVTQKAYDPYRHLVGLPIQSVELIAMNEVSSIYKVEYWVPNLPAPLDLCTFDSAVQHGRGRAIKWLQRCLDQTEDGKIGPVSVRALDEVIAKGGLKNLVYLYNAVRDRFYAEIIKNDPSQERFRHGWESRMHEVRLACAEFEA